MNIHTLKNGLVVILDEIPYLESVAYSLRIPGGIFVDSQEKQGQALVLAELMTKGAGPYNSREFSDAFDDLGVRHSEGADLESVMFQGSLLAQYLDKALNLVSLMVKEPRLPSEDIENIKSLYLQDLKALKDNPSRRCLIELQKRYLPDPYGRPSVGTEEGISSCTEEVLKKEWKRRVKPNGSVLSIAGNIRADEVLTLVEKLFGDWVGDALGRPKFGKVNQGQLYHLQQDAAQLQIGLSYKSAPFGDPYYYTSKVATQILSGGMFGRLFIEVREKRGLCYSVYAYHSGDSNRGTVTAYAGTTPDRAQETLDVMVLELQRLRGTIEDSELGRAKANLKASLVLSQESSAARAGSNSGDWWLNKRVRTLEEIGDAIDAVSIEDIHKYDEAYPATNITLLTLGAKELILRH